MLIRANTGLTEIYANHKGKVLQCDKQNCFKIQFAGYHINLKVKDFLKFKKLVEGIDVAHLILEVKQADIEILHLRGSDHFFILTICELVALKELLAGTKAMLELYRILALNGCSTCPN
ncbi:MAG: DUF6686 family protein [Cyclobacteriaceae bacterium]